MKRLMALGVCVGALLSSWAWADDDDDDDDEREQGRAAQLSRTSPQWKAYEAECGSCHLAYPPRMLPAKSWTALVAGLKDHFGQNAEVDAATAKTLEGWLRANSDPRTAGAPLRITELGWWRREHREVSSAVYARKAISTPANCSACHPRANQGAFGEHEVRIPRDAPAAR